MAKNNTNKSSDRKLQFAENLPLGKQKIGKLNPNFGSPLRPKPVMDKAVESESRRVRQEAFNPQLNAEPLKLRAAKRQQDVTASIPTTSSRENSSTTRTITSSKDTSTTPRSTSPDNYNSNMPKRNYNNRPGKGSDYNKVERISGINFNANEFTSSYKDSTGQYLPDTSISSPVNFELDIYNTTHLNQGELTNLVNAGETIAKLDINVSNFYTVVSNAYGRTTTSCTAGSSDTYTIPFGDVYTKMTLDIYKDARSNLYSNWSQQNLCTALGYTCQAIEYLVTLDSILAYQPKFNTPFDVNRNLIVYQSNYTSGAVLSARLNLLRAVKGTWFPPKFLELIRWFYQNYRKGTGSQCAAYRYVPDGNFTINNGSLNSNLVTAMNTLASNIDTSTVSQQIWSQLAKVYPEGIIKNVPGSHNDVTYDRYHYEVFNNEPLVYTDVNNSNKLSAHPITYSSTTDVAYYMDVDPSTTNGFAFLLGLTFNSSDASTNAINLTSTTTPYFNGLRCISSFTLANSNFGSLSCNKWSFNANNSQMNTRCYSIGQSYASTDAHNVFTHPTNGGTAFTTTYTISRIPAGFQRVYFDNAIAANTMSKFMMNHLFGLPA